ncbi:sulfotransferase domain-containing protein [Marinobacter bryozoorum]|uniref:sulfotransferase family protein n=1 Tax=Marinobacter bryozoorum TaxID=256324 RepID=UPI002002F9AD|nr:sulfotransferase [Marinobacter bryozoorum]MCK7544035.1 sulfotransferase domain-containing protein [Marinobacter bryozoorum]
MSSTQNKPNFLIIGAARSGSTSLFLYLEQHPEIYFSEVKELNFFSNPSFWKKGFSWYETWFRPRSKRITCIGEASTSYTRSPFLEHAPGRIFDYNSDMKLIYVVRNPLDRLVSHYLHNINAGIEDRDIEKLLENLPLEPIAWQGKYHYQLSRYLEFFNRNQLYVTSFEKLSNEPEQVTKEIFDFLGVNSDVSLEKIGRVFNSSNKTTKKSQLGLRILDLYRRTIQYQALPYRVKKLVQNIAEIGSTPITKPTLSLNEKEALYDFYKEDSQLLQTEFGIRTEDWFPPLQG